MPAARIEGGAASAYKNLRCNGQDAVADVAIGPLEARDERQWRQLWTVCLEFYESFIKYSRL